MGAAAGSRIRPAVRRSAAAIPGQAARSPASRQSERSRRRFAEQPARRAFPNQHRDRVADRDLDVRRLRILLEANAQSSPLAGRARCETTRSSTSTTSKRISPPACPCSTTSLVEGPALGIHEHPPTDSVTRQARGRRRLHRFRRCQPKRQTLSRQDGNPKPPSIRGVPREVTMLVSDCRLLGDVNPPRKDRECSFNCRPGRKSRLIFRPAAESSCRSARPSSTGRAA